MQESDNNIKFVVNGINITVTFNIRVDYSDLFNDPLNVVPSVEVAMGEFGIRKLSWSCSLEMNVNA